MTLGQVGFLVLLSQVALFVAFTWLFWWLTKTAIREGIKESGLVEAIRRSSSRGPQEQLPDWATKTGLPDMRAD
jgi:hypothetical protein